MNGRAWFRLPANKMRLVRWIQVYINVASYTAYAVLPLAIAVYLISFFVFGFEDGLGFVEESAWIGPVVACSAGAFVIAIAASVWATSLEAEIRKQQESLDH